jgi:hypothetical protein
LEKLQKYEETPAQKADREIKNQENLERIKTKLARKEYDRITTEPEKKKAFVSV